MDRILRHKIVKRSGLPFNSMLRELKDKVKLVPAGATWRMRNMKISNRVHRRLMKRGVTPAMVEDTFHHGVIDARCCLSTSTPSGGRRLLRDHERQNKTVLKRCNGVSIRYTESPLRLVDAYLNIRTVVETCVEVKSWK